MGDTNGKFLGGLLQTCHVDLFLKCKYMDEYVTTESHICFVIIIIILIKMRVFNLVFLSMLKKKYIIKLRVNSHIFCHYSSNIGCDWIQ